MIRKDMNWDTQSIVFKEKKLSLALRWLKHGVDKITCYKIKLIIKKKKRKKKRE